MEVVPFKVKYVRDIVGWIETEAQMVQWAGATFAWPLTQKQFREHLRAGLTPPPTLYPFALLERGHLAGCCDLSRHCRRSNHAMLSRVLIAPKLRNRGMGQFMIRHVLAFGFEHLGLNRIGLGVFDFNEAAIACYRRLGFQLEGTLRESARAGDAYWNCHLMSILRREWRP